VTEDHLSFRWDCGTRPARHNRQRAIRRRVTLPFSSDLPHTFPYRPRTSRDLRTRSQRVQRPLATARSHFCCSAPAHLTSCSSFSRAVRHLPRLCDVLFSRNNGNTTQSGTGCLLQPHQIFLFFESRHTSPPLRCAGVPVFGVVAVRSGHVLSGQRSTLRLAWNPRPGRCSGRRGRIAGWGSNPCPGGQGGRACRCSSLPL
jgi:hypothetical protein